MNSFIQKYLFKNTRSEIKQFHKIWDNYKSFERELWNCEVGMKLWRGGEKFEGKELRTEKGSEVPQSLLGLPTGQAHRIARSASLALTECPHLIPVHERRHSSPCQRSMSPVIVVRAGTALGWPSSVLDGRQRWRRHRVLQYGIRSEPSLSPSAGVYLTTQPSGSFWNLLPCAKPLELHRHRDCPTKQPNKTRGTGYQCL